VKLVFGEFSSGVSITLKKIFSQIWGRFLPGTKVNMKSHL